MEKTRLGLVGCGSRGRYLLRIFNDFEDVTLAAACDPFAESRQVTVDEFGIEEQYETVDEMLESSELDAVVVAPLANLNYELALPCIERGVHVMMEKPPGLTSQETRHLRETAARTGSKVLVGWNRRFHPVIVQARSLILERGPLIQLVGEFHKNVRQPTRLADTMMDRLFLETPIHAVDTIRYLAASDVKEVHSIVRRVTSEYRDVHAALIEFENGVVAQLTHNYTAGGRLERYEIHGQDISAYMEGVSGGQIVADGETTEIVKGPTAGAEEQNRYFIDCARNDKPIELPAANLVEAVKTMELAEAILAGTR
jgi:virulence factor